MRFPAKASAPAAPALRCAGPHFFDFECPILRMRDSDPGMVASLKSDLGLSHSVFPPNVPQGGLFTSVSEDRDLHVWDLRGRTPLAAPRDACEMKREKDDQY